MKSFIIFVGLCLPSTFVEGLKCYDCLYLDGVLPDELSSEVPSEPSCKDGRIPDKKFIVDCDELQYSRNKVNGTCGVSTVLNTFLRNKSQPITAPNQDYQVTYTCVSLSYDGNFYPYYGAGKMRATFRYCLGKVLEVIDDTFKEECHNGKMNNLNISDAVVRYAVHSQGLGPFMDINATDVNICTCNNDNCNGNGVLRKSQVSYFLVVSSFAAVVKTIIS